MNAGTSADHGYSGSIISEAGNKRQEERIMDVRITCKDRLALTGDHKGKTAVFAAAHNNEVYDNAKAYSDSNDKL